MAGGGEGDRERRKKEGRMGKKKGVRWIEKKRQSQSEREQRETRGEAVWLLGCLYYVIIT